MRWTIVSLHRPLWDGPGLAENGWLTVEKALQGRPYTVFAGHIHRFQKFVRQPLRVSVCAGNAEALLKIFFRPLV